MLWQDQFDGTSQSWDAAKAIAATVTQAFVAGYVRNVGKLDDFTVRAYKAK
jgi:hypothetical protein